MFGNTKRELKFAKLTEKAIARYKGFDVRIKGLSKKDLTRGIEDASRSGVTTIIDGLREEVKVIVASEFDDEAAQIADAFRLAKMSVNRMLSVSRVKSGTAHWLTFAMKGIDEPQQKRKRIHWIDETMGEKGSDEALKSVDLDDGTPIWLKGESKESQKSTVSPVLGDFIWNKESDDPVASKQGTPSMISKLRELEQLAAAGNIKKMVAAFDDVIAEILATDFENKGELIKNAVRELTELIGDERALELISESKSFSKIGELLAG